MVICKQPHIGGEGEHSSQHWQADHAINRGSLLQSRSIMIRECIAHTLEMHPENLSYGLVSPYSTFLVSAVSDHDVKSTYT